MEEKILTKHPTKNGFNINRAKYDNTRKSIIIWRTKTKPQKYRLAKR